MFNIGNKFGDGGMDRIITEGNDSDMIIMIYNPYEQVENRSVEFEIRGIVPWTFAKNHLENPIAQSLVGKKICLYTRTLKTLLAK
jgi:hypothetical protein